MGCTLNKVLDKLVTVHADYIRLVGTFLLLQDVRFLRVYNLQTKGLFIWEEVIPVSEKTFRLAK